jgi:chromosome partitioning protein
MYNAVIDKVEPKRLIHGTEIEYLSFIPSNIWTNDEETLYLSTINDDLLVIKRILDVLKTEYEFIIVDCPPSLGAVTMAGIAAADYLLVPVQSEYFALKTIGRLMRMARVVGGRYNPDLKLLGFLLTMVDGRTTTSKEVAYDLRRDLKTKVFETMTHGFLRWGGIVEQAHEAIAWLGRCVRQ